MAEAPYSKTVVMGDVLYISGQLGRDADGTTVPGGFGPQLAQVLANLDALLQEHGVDRSRVAKTNVYLTDAGDWPALNDAYVAFFADPRPARSTVVVASLLGDAVVEVDAIAHLG